MLSVEGKDLSMAKTLIVERDIEARMRDGTVLRADVYRPDSEGPLPVLLQDRLQYNP